DEDVVMEETVEKGDGNGRMAKVLEEAEDTVMGGLDEPGYREDEEVEIEREKKKERIHSRPFYHEFTPEGDDDLCVVA
ncbi:hypothetical protein PENTCL1PPCAC_10997, partial [Pristionchus entomophagus]